mgnify:CR=1 FL=1
MYYYKPLKSICSRSKRFDLRRVTLSSLILIALLGSIGVRFSNAHTPDTAVSSYSLETLVGLALQRNPYLLAARTVVDGAEGGVLEAGRLDNPSLNLRYASDQIFNNEGESNLGIGFAQKFPITQRLKLERWIAEDSVRLAEAEIVERELILRKEVEHAVYELAATLAERALSDQILALNQEWLSFIESGIERGEASQVDANRLSLEIYTMEETRHELISQEIVSKAKIRQLCGFHHLDSFDLDFELSLPPELPQLPNFGRLHMELHPSYVVGKQLLEIAEKNLSLAKAARWTDIEVEVFYREERGVDTPNGLGRDRFFGVGLSIPLPLHSQGHGAIAQRKAAVDRMLWELRATESKLLNDAAVQRLLVGHLYEQALEYHEDITPILASNQKLMREAYTSGQISLTDLFRMQEKELHIKSVQQAHLVELEESLSHWRSATGLETTY